MTYTASKHPIKSQAAGMRGLQYILSVIGHSVINVLVPAVTQKKAMPGKHKLSNWAA